MRNQQGAALLVLVMIMLTAASYLLLKALRGSPLERDKVTVAALAQAKEALIGYAASNSVVPSGSLPCPDTNNDGGAEPLVGGVCPSYLGRLPWRTLGLSDLRDADGEPLWYALSPTFRNGQTITATMPGEITVRDNTGAALPNRAIAVVMAPGKVLTRQDGVIQNRMAANRNVPSHFLDIGLGVDNALPTANNLIRGEVLNPATRVIIVNDRVLDLSPAAFFAAVTKVLPPP